MRPPLYFDGEPDTFRQLQRLFASESRLRVRYAAPDRERLQLDRADRSDAAASAGPRPRSTAA